jgi:hypothetical protein
LLIHTLPFKLRKRAVQHHLGPAPGWFAGSKFEGRVTKHLGTRMKQVGLRGGGVSLAFAQQDGSGTEVQFDPRDCCHGIQGQLPAASFYERRPSRGDGHGRRYSYPQSQLRVLRARTVLRRLASSTSFGPLCRFAYGAKFTLEAFGPAPRPYSLERHCLVVTSQVTRFGTEGNFGAEA